MGIGGRTRGPRAGRLLGLDCVLPATCCLLLLSGCGGGTDLPDRAKVHGLVTLDGKPLGSGTVIFEPDASKGTSGPPAYGQINEQGRYELTTDRDSPGDGAVVGRHKVRVQARQDVEPGQLARSLIPAAYDDPNRSGLAAEVKAGEVNTVDLKLKSTP